MPLQDDFQAFLEEDKRKQPAPKDDFQAFLDEERSARPAKPAPSPSPAAQPAKPFRDRMREMGVDPDYPFAPPVEEKPPSAPQSLRPGTKVKLRDDWRNLSSVQIGEGAPRPVQGPPAPSVRGPLKPGTTVRSSRLSPEELSARFDDADMKIRQTLANPNEASSFSPDEWRALAASAERANLAIPAPPARRVFRPLVTAPLRGQEALREPTWRDLSPEVRALVDDPQAAQSLTPEARQYLEGLRSEEKQAQAAFERESDIKNAPSYPEQLANRFMRGATGTLDSSVRGFSLLRPEIEADLRGKGVLASPEERAQLMRRTLPVDPTDESLLSKGVEAAGSAVPFAGMSLLGGMAGAPAWIAPMLLGAASNAGSTYDEAIGAGQTPEAAKRAAIIGALIGLTEGLGVGRFGGSATRAAGRSLTRTLAGEFSEEGFQEAFNQALNNVNAKMLSGYDPKRAISDGVAESFLLGGLVGGTFGLPGGLAEKAAQLSERAGAVEAVRAEPGAPLNLTPTTIGPTNLISLRQAAGQPEFRQKIEDATGTPPPPAPPAGAQPAGGGDRLSAAIGQLKTLRSGQAAAAPKPTLDQTLADLEGKAEQFAAYAIQNADTDPDTANQTLEQAIGSYTQAANALKKSDEYQQELLAITQGQAAETPLRDKLNYFNATLEGLRAFSERDERAAAEAKKAEKEAEKQAKLAEQTAKAKEAEARQAEAKTAQATRQQETAARSQETALRRADEQSTREAEGEIRRMRLFDESVEAAERAADEAQSLIAFGDYPNAIGKLRARQDALRQSLRYMAETPEAVRVRADATAEIEAINALVPNLRRQALGRPQNLQGPQTGPGRAVGVGSDQAPGSGTPLLGSITNPEGGVPASEILYSPGAIFERLAQKSRGTGEEQVSLLTTIRRLGGISDDGDTSGELRRLGLKEAGTTGLMKRNGLSPDRMREALAEEGLLPVDSTVADLYVAIEDELRAEQGRRGRQEETEEEYYARQAEDLDFQETQPAAPQESPVGLEPAEPVIAARTERVERRPVPAATAENIEDLRNRREELSRLRYDRAGEFDADLADEYRELGAQIKTFENAQEEADRGGRIEDAPPAWADTRPYQPPTREQIGRAFAAAEARLDQEVARAVEALPKDDAEILKRGAAAIDALFTEVERDVDALDILDRAIEGDTDAETEFRAYADRRLGAAAGDVDSLFDARRARRERGAIRQRAEAARGQNTDETGAARYGEDGPPVETGAQARELSARDLDLLNQDPGEVADQDFDSFLRSLESLNNDRLVGAVDMPEWATRQLEARLKLTNQIRRARVKQKRLGPKNAPLPQKAKPLGKVKGGRRLVEQAKAREKKAEQKPEEPPTVIHPNPEIDRKPILAETNRGTVLVPNPNNKTGVSEVKDRSDEPSEHSFTSTQVDLPKDVADTIIAFGRRIPDSDLAEDGRETEPHITVKYGLHGWDSKFVEEALKGETPAKVTFGKVSLFENDEFDVVKVDVESEDLQRLNKKVSESQPNTENFPEYKPHATIAYVKKGLGKTYAGDTFLEGQTASLDSITFSGRDGERLEIPLSTKPAAAVKAKPKVDWRIPEEAMPELRGGPKPKTNRISLPARRHAERLVSRWQDFANSRTDYDTLVKESRVEYRADPKSPRVGIIYLNSHARRLYELMLSEYNNREESFAATSVKADNLPAHQGMLRYFMNKERANPDAVWRISQFNVAIARALSEGVDGVILFDVHLPGEHWHWVLAHEAFHVWQFGAPELGAGWIESQPGYDKIRTELLAENYQDEPASLAREWAAYAATNDLERFGFTQKEALTFLDAYFDEIVSQGGIDALGRVGNVAPDARDIIARKRKQYGDRSQTTQRPRAKGRRPSSKTGPETSDFAAGRSPSGSRVSLQGGTGSGRERGSRAADEGEVRRDQSAGSALKFALADNPSDETKVKVAALGLESKTAPSRPASAVAVKRNIPIDDITLGRDDLSKGRMYQVQEALKGGVRRERRGVRRAEQIDPIVVVPDPKQPGKWIVSDDGNHRIALLKLQGFKGDVPVTAWEAPVEAVRKRAAAQAFLFDEGGSASLGLGFGKLLRKATRRTQIPVPEDFDPANYAEAVIAEAQRRGVSGKREERLAGALERLIAAFDKNDGWAVVDAHKAINKIIGTRRSNAEIEKIDPGAFAKLSTLRKAGMLAGIPTHVRNFLGNTVFQQVEEISRMPAAMADMLVSVATKRRTVAGPSATASARAIGKAVTEGGREAIQVMKKGLTTKQQEEQQLRETRFRNPILDAYTKYVFRALSASDEIFFTGAYTRAIEERARLQALNEARADVIKRDDVKQRRKELRDNPDLDMQLAAMEDARIAVFRNDNKFSDIVSAARGRLGAGGNFAVDLVMPFDRTPSNIFVRTLEYTPIGYGRNVIQLGRAMINREFTPEQQREFSRVFGRATTGTFGVMLLGWALAARGLMTGFYDEEDKQKEALRRSAGQMPASVRIGDRWYSVGGLAPLGTLMALGATVYRESHEKVKDEEDRPLKSLRASSKFALDLPLMKGTKEVLDAVTQPGSLGQKSGRIAASFIPRPIPEIGTLTDDYQRDTKTQLKGFRKIGSEFGREIASRLPGARNYLPPKMDTFGEPVRTETSDVIDPFSSRPAKDQDSPVKRELLRLEMTLPILPRPKGEPAELQKARAGRRKGYIDQYGAALIESEPYQAADDDLKAKMLKRFAERTNELANDRDPDLGKLDADAIANGIRKSEKSTEKRRERSRERLFYASQ